MTTLSHGSFTAAWQGVCKCGKLVGECEEHNEVVCVSCGSTAVRECPAHLGPISCGAPLCQDCEHVVAPNGTTSRKLVHCRSIEQKYLPWTSMSPEDIAEGNARMAAQAVADWNQIQRQGAQGAEKLVATASETFLEAAKKVPICLARRIWTEIVGDSFPTNHQHLLV